MRYKLAATETFRSFSRDGRHCRRKTGRGLLIPGSAIRNCAVPVRHLFVEGAARALEEHARKAAISLRFEGARVTCGEGGSWVAHRPGAIRRSRDGRSQHGIRRGRPGQLRAAPRPRSCFTTTLTIWWRGCPSRPGMRVLETACGTGVVTRRLVDRLVGGPGQAVEPATPTATGPHHQRTLPGRPTAQ